MDSKIAAEKERCLTITDEALKKLLELIGEELKARNYTFKTAEEVYSFVLIVAQRFYERYPRIGSIFEGNPKDCHNFFDIFTEKQKTAIREFFQSFRLKLELVTFKEAVKDYISLNFKLFKNRIKVEGRSEEEIKEAWNKNMNPYKKIAEEDIIYHARIASLRVKGNGEKSYDSDPIFLTCLMMFELIVSPSRQEFQRLKEALFREKVESVEEILKTLAKNEWIKYDFEKDIYEDDFEQIWKENKKKITKIIEDLFDAVDSSVRKRLELEYFKDLIALAKSEGDLKEIVQRVEKNLQILGELYDEGYTDLGNILVEVIPVGFKFENKITDYRAEKDFRYFLYTYKLKLNDIAEGAIINHLEKSGEVNPKDVNNRSKFFLTQGKLFVTIVNGLKKDEKPKTQLSQKLPSYLLGFLKALFYYTDVDKETLKELYEDYLKLRELDIQQLNESDLTFLKKLKEKVEKLLPKLEKEHDNFERLYKTIADKYLKQFLEEDLPRDFKELFVAVDFTSLVREIKKLPEDSELSPKTQLYRGILKVLTEKRETEDFEYTFRVKNIIYNHRLDLDREISPQIKYLKPLKDWKNLFNATAELSKEKLTNGKESFKFAFILTYILILEKIAMDSGGLILGASLPHSPNGKEDYRVEKSRNLIYKIFTSVNFALTSDKIAAVQNFNWKNIKARTVNPEKGKKLQRVLNNLLNKVLNINPKLKNGLTSLFSYLPFEVEGLNLKHKTAVLAISHPTPADKNQRKVIGEAYIFEPLRSIDLFNHHNAVRVTRKTLMPDGIINYTSGDSKNLKSAYKEILEEFVKQLKVEKIYLIPPLPLYRGLSTKEDFLRELYFGDLLATLGEELKVSLKLVFSSFGVVYTPHLKNFIERLTRFIKSRHPNLQRDNRKNIVISANLFKKIEKVVPQSGAFPLVIPKFAIIPFLSLKGDKEEKRTLFHHAFIYSVPNHRLFEGVKPEKLFLTEEEKIELANLLSVIHLIQYQKAEDTDKKKKEWEKTFKRSPFLVFPERRSGDKNILSLTEVEIFFNQRVRPKLQIALLAFDIWKNLKRNESPSL